MESPKEGLAVDIPEFGFAWFKNDGTIKFRPEGSRNSINVPPESAETLVFLILTHLQP
jgi:hypothetical protein